MNIKPAKPSTFEPKPATQMVHGGTLRSSFGETSEAVFLTSGYAYDSAEQAEARFKGEDKGFIYSRFSNPTVAMFEERMCQLEGAEMARGTATGMAAVTSALLCQLRAGDHVVAAKALFGSCLYVIEELLPRFGITTTLVDGTNLYSWAQAVQPNTKAFFLESPTNPTLEVIDIEGVAAIADQAGARLIVDNVFATPLHQRPLQLGAHVVVYSATKHIDGQGRCLGGVVLSDEEFILENLHNFLRQTGPSISPFNAWIMLKGLETLDLRTQRHCESAATIANYLLEQKKITNVRYPGLDTHPQAEIVKKQMSSGGPIVAFEVVGGKEAAFKFANALQIILISNNLGDSKSLITHPATTTHHRLSEEARFELGINGSMQRLSVGLEDVSDLIADIDVALSAI